MRTRIGFYGLVALFAATGCPSDQTEGDADADGGSSSGTPASASASSSGGSSSAASESSDSNPSQPATTEPPTMSASNTMPESETTPPTESETNNSATDSDSESSSESSSESGKIEEDPVRFIAFGDGGEGNDSQYAVAGIVEQICGDRGCDHAIYLGDNFYDVGVESTMDVQFTDKFELPYADVADMPFYITLGNHDYGTIGNEWYKSQFQIEYTEFSNKWTMPSEFYSFDAGGVTFISLDTNRLFWDFNADDQAQFLRGVLATTDKPVTVAFGHHPYISNGRHGNAGNYEGLPIPIVGGEDVKDFFDEEVCGKVTVYFSGHDHNRQWHPETCGTVFIVSGAAAKTTDFENRDGNPAPLFQDDQTPGFAWVEIIGKSMTLAWYDQEGAMEFENTITLP